MDKKTATKAGAGGLGVVLLALSVILGSLGTTTDVDGRYVVNETTSQTKTFIAEHIEEVPEATFYDLVVTTDEGDVVLGKSNFGGTGVVSANIIFNPIDKLSVVVYDADLDEIGVGKVNSDGTIDYKIKEELIVDENKQTSE